MKRQFFLEEFNSREDFNLLCSAYGIPPDRSPVVKGNKDKRFFRTLNTEVYKNLNQVLSLNDKHQPFLANIWEPDGNLRVGEAGRLTRTEFTKYVRGLLRHQKDINKIRIELSSDLGWSMVKNSDQFLFQRQDNIWTLRYLHVRDINFSFYEFEGANINGARTHSISAIYDS